MALSDAPSPGTDQEDANADNLSAGSKRRRELSDTAKRPIFSFADEVSDGDDPWAEPEVASNASSPAIETKAGTPAVSPSKGPTKEQLLEQKQREERARKMIEARKRKEREKEQQLIKERERQAKMCESLAGVLVKGLHADDLDGSTAKSTAKNLAMDIVVAVSDRVKQTQEGHGQISFLKERLALKDNSAILRQIVTGSITAEAAARLTQEDLATQEEKEKQSKQRQQALLDLHVDRAKEISRINTRKTHKGVEVIDEDRVVEEDEAEERANQVNENEAEPKERKLERRIGGLFGAIGGDDSDDSDEQSSDDDLMSAKPRAVAGKTVAVNVTAAAAPPSPVKSLSPRNTIPAPEEVSEKHCSSQFPDIWPHNRSPLATTGQIVWRGKVRLSDRDSFMPSVMRHLGGSTGIYEKLGSDLTCPGTLREAKAGTFALEQIADEKRMFTLFRLEPDGSDSKKLFNSTIQAKLRQGRAVVLYDKASIGMAYIFGRGDCAAKMIAQDLTTKDTLYSKIVDDDSLMVGWAMHGQPPLPDGQMPAVKSGAAELDDEDKALFAGLSKEQGSVNNSAVDSNVDEDAVQYDDPDPFDADNMPGTPEDLAQNGDEDLEDGEIPEESAISVQPKGYPSDFAPGQWMHARPITCEINLHKLMPSVENIHVHMYSLTQNPNHSASLIGQMHLTSLVPKTIQPLGRAMSSEISAYVMRNVNTPDARRRWLFLAVRGVQESDRLALEQLQSMLSEKNKSLVLLESKSCVAYMLANDVYIADQLGRANTKVAEGQEGLEASSNIAQPQLMKSLIVFILWTPDEGEEPTIEGQVDRHNIPEHQKGGGPSTQDPTQSQGSAHTHRQEARAASAAHDAQAAAAQAFLHASGAQPYAPQQHISNSNRTAAPAWQHVQGGAVAPQTWQHGHAQTQAPAGQWQPGNRVEQQQWTAGAQPHNGFAQNNRMQRPSGYMHPSRLSQQQGSAQGYQPYGQQPPMRGQQYGQQQWERGRQPPPRDRGYR